MLRVQRYEKMEIWRGKLETGDRKAVSHEPRALSFELSVFSFYGNEKRNLVARLQSLPSADDYSN